MVYKWIYIQSLATLMGAKRTVLPNVPRGRSTLKGLLGLWDPSMREYTLLLIHLKTDSTKLEGHPGILWL